MRRRLRWIRVLFWLAVCAFLLLHFIDSLWTNSVDLAHHGALVTRLMERWRLPDANDPTLGEMTIYPPGSHIVAAVAGTLLDSPVAGLQVVTLLSLVALWSGVAFALESLPRRMFVAVGIALGVLLLANRGLVHLELHGEEVVGNFFFAQLVAQAVSVVLLLLALHWERRRMPQILTYLLLAGASWVMVGIHLLPALELLGVLSLLVAVDGVNAAGGRRVRSFLPGIASVIVTLALILLHPGFRAMRMISENNGALPLRYTPDLAMLGILCVIVLALSALTLLRWLRASDSRSRRNGLALKYFGLYGMSVASLGGTQIFLRAVFGIGSPYACFKYVFALNTLLLLHVALWLVVILRLGRLGERHELAHPPGLLLVQIIPGALVLTALLCVLPAARTTAASTLIRTERVARNYHELLMERMAGKNDYAVGIRDIASTGNYLISIATLKAPRTANAYDVVFNRPLSEHDRVGHILTSENSKPWDVPACRQRLLDGSLVVVDGACVFAHAVSVCAGEVDLTAAGNVGDGFTTGFSQPEPDGTWSDGPVASIKCQAPSGPKKRPSKVGIASSGLVIGDHKQRMLVSINGGPPREFRYETAGEAKSIELDLPEPSGGRWEFRFAFPDAISPRELGLNTDTRKLAVKLHSMRFE